MSKCSKCGAELPTDVQFCEKCGTGDRKAMLDLAVKYRDGKGVAKDVNHAFVLTYEAIAKGSKQRAFSVLGYFYLLGKFAKQNYKKANELFCRAANAGWGKGLYELGVSYLNGRGVEKNLEAAKFLFEKAIEKGSKDAAEEIKKIPASVRADSSGISGYTGKTDTGPLPDYVVSDYEKAKAGTLWSEAFDKKCKTCHDKGRVTCPKCGGKKEFECEKCHGKGHFSKCPKCGSTGEVTCSNCGGSGRVRPVCPVCHGSGKVSKERPVRCKWCHGSGRSETGYTCKSCSGHGQVTEHYQDFCPHCNGTGRDTEGSVTCRDCQGTGKETCDRCRGSGKAVCKTCGGKGKYKCERCGGTGDIRCPACQERERKRAAAEYERTRSSYQNRARFMVLGVAFGLLGVHYAYIRRWFLLLVQLVLTGCGVAQYMVPAIGQPITDFMLLYSMKLNEAGLPWLGLALQYPLLLIALVWALLGAFFVRKDGTNHKMNYNPGKLDFVIVAIAQFLLLVYVLSIIGPDKIGADEARRSIFMRIGVWSWMIPFLFAKQWKYFFISMVPILVDGAYVIGITPLKLWNSLLGFYFLWHVWAVIRTRKEL